MILLDMMLGSYRLIALCWLAVLASNAEPSPGPYRPTNLLFVMFDDLRPELSIYGRDFMITPNFERLARRSVVFDYAFCQVAVCNPSRDSILTGLRPDSVGTYNFGHSYWPHMTLPMQLARSGYHTAGIGKLHHWENDNKEIWNFDAFNGKWYTYQGVETKLMNSTVMPDRRDEEDFRDALFTRRAIDTWTKLLKSPKPYMLAVGYKLPHTALHVPHAFYQMYANHSQHWKLTKKELRFPSTAPEISYRCCADPEYRYMREEGTLKANRSLRLHPPSSMDLHNPLPLAMHDELMRGYAAAVSYVDRMLGRLLDFMDKHELWDNTTIVLTADHGMHNGEKGIWEKWSLFEESTRVPLLISHPQSPNQGKRYKYPVELIDIYATVSELMALAPADKASAACKGIRCKPLQGKSLVPVLFGQPKQQSLQSSVLSNVQSFLSSLRGTRSTSAVAAVTASANASSSDELPMLEHNFAISQTLRCAPIKEIPPRISRGSSASHAKDKPARKAIWRDCDLAKHEPELLTLLGYAMRTPEYRYVAYFHFNRSTQLPDTARPPYEEELYDHKNETLADFTHRETFNLAVKVVQYNSTLQALRSKLVSFIQTKIVFGDH